MNLDTMNGADLAKFAEDVIQSYATRDEKIQKARNIRSKKWTPYIPEAWRVPERKDTHSSYGPAVPINCMSLTAANEPTYTRTPPDTDIVVAKKSDTVENYLHSAFDKEDVEGVAGRSSWFWINDQMNNYGGCCIGSLLAIHGWASAPPMSDREGKIRKEFWRNKKGVVPEDGEPFDDVASAKAFIKAVEEHRRRAESPVIRRYTPLDQAKPVFVGRTMMAMVLRRKSSPMELTSLGFQLDSGAGGLSVDKSQELTEIWTPNRCRCLIGDRELEHDVYGSGGIVHNYGFIPFAYKCGLPDDECDAEFGVWGSPILSIVADQIINIDTILTVRNNAAYLAGFPTPVAEDTTPQDAVSLSAGEGKMQHLQIKSGMVNYFPGKRIYYLLSNGTGPDFEKALVDEREELRRLLPDALLGKAASSGYNTAQAIQQGLGFLGSVFKGNQGLLRIQAAHELRLINDFVPGPVYYDYAYRNNNFGAGPLKMRKLKISANDIQNYFAVKVEISRVVDQITLSSHMAQLQAQGLATVDEVLESRGVTDTEATKAQILVDQFLASDLVKQQLTQDAIEEAGLAELQQEVMAEQQLTTLPDGSQGVMMPDGTVAAPGMAPEQQGAAGAMLGGMNLNSMGPNMASTNNPTINLPTKEQPNRARRRGGAIPGAAQRQGWAKTVQ